jgi:hypothetical protein
LVYHKKIFLGLNNSENRIANRRRAVEHEIPIHAIKYRVKQVHIRFYINPSKDKNTVTTEISEPNAPTM